MGVAKVTNNLKDLNKAETAEKQAYAKLPEFSPALGVFIFGKKSVATHLR